MVGGFVVLKPDNVPDKIDRILWYCGPNFAAESIRGKKTFYGNFAGILNRPLQCFLLVCEVQNGKEVCVCPQVGQNLTSRQESSRSET